MISPPRYLKIDIQPGNHPYVLDGQSQAQKQFHRQRQQHTHCKKLKRQVLEQARARQQLLLELVLWEQISAERTAEPDLLEIDRHQPVKEERAHHVKTADDN